MSVSTCGCKGISHGYPNFLWQGATPIILGWFPGYTWKIKTSDVPRDLNYFVIFLPCVHSLQMWQWVA